MRGYGAYPMELGGKRWKEERGIEGREGGRKKGEEEVGGQGAWRNVEEALIRKAQRAC